MLQITYWRKYVDMARATATCAYPLWYNYARRLLSCGWCYHQTAATLLTSFSP